AALLPPITRLEKVTQALFDDPEMRLKFNPKGRMRGDTAAQTAAYAAGRQWGYLSANDIRADEDESPIDGGDVYLEPVNMIPAGSAPVQRADGGTIDVPQLSPAAFRAIGPVRRAAANDAPAWVTRIDTVLAEYVRDLRDQLTEIPTDDDRTVWDELLTEALTPSLAGVVTEFGTRQAETRGEVFLADAAANWVAAVAASEARAFNSRAFFAMSGADADERPSLARAFDDVLASTATAAELIVNRSGSFGRFEGAAQTGAREKRWNAATDAACDHASMHGETVAIDQPFSNGAMWPGDRAAGATEAAACSCGLEFDY
ncbi:MAG: phage portal protein, partial [Actinobacteria bacterium]|nr:phage portal protein [Actinomycetota bacterium]